VKTLYTADMLVSHHGAYEFGSPKLPQTLEAVILHLLDDLDGKIANLPEKDPGSKWTVFHRPTAEVSIDSIPVRKTAIHDY